jgi:hypothetical protein
MTSGKVAFACLPDLPKYRIEQPRWLYCAIALTAGAAYQVIDNRMAIALLSFASGYFWLI